MKTTKILSNKNTLCSESTSEAWYSKENGDFSIRVVLKGDEKYTIGTRQLIVYPNNFLALNSGTSYSRRIYSDDVVQTFSILFAKDFLDDFHQSYNGNVQLSLDDPFALKKQGTPRFLESLYPFSGDLKFNVMHLKKHFDANLDNEMLMNEYLHHCLVLYYKIYENEVIIKSNNLNFYNQQTKTEILKRLTIARDYIHSNYNSPITLEDISQQSYLSVNHLLRNFKQAFACSPHQYLMRVRLNRARYLLKNSSNSVNEIVNLVGFECPSSFIRLFKNTFNVTPGTFRAA